MQAISKIVLFAALALALGACDGKEEIAQPTREPATEPGVETARDRIPPGETAATSPTGMPATGTPRPGAVPADAGFQQPAATRITAAVAQLEPTEGNSVQGDVRFELASAGIQSAEMDGAGLILRGTIEGLSPGDHGFHVHEFGDCSAPDASSAGGHFNPEGQAHGGPDEAVRHIGDLGNVQATEDGTAALDMQDNRLALSGGHSIIGRALVVHASADDLESQPSGDSGDRVACGVIGIAAAESAGAATGAQPPAGETPEPGAESDPMTPDAPTDDQADAAEPTAP